MKIAEFKSEGHYQAFLPEKSLSNFIEGFWIFNLNKKSGHEKKELIQPSLFPEVIFKIGCDYENHHINSKETEIIKSSIISGIQLEAIGSKRCNTEEKVLLIGIKFNPIGLYHILNIPLNEILNKRIELVDLSCDILNRIESKLQNAKSNLGIIDILNSNFSSYFQNCSFNAECKSIYAAMGLNSSEKLYNQKHKAYSSYKSLERKFNKYIGIPPSKYYKHKRFINFYLDWRHINQTKYIDLVYQNNYYDQNHLIKDFKSVLGQSPNKFKKTKSEYFTEHILDSTLPNLEIGNHY